MERIICDTAYDRVSSFSFDAESYDESDLEGTRRFTVIDTGARSQIGSQGAEDSPSEYIAQAEIVVVYNAGQVADELRKVIAEDIDRIRHTIQLPANQSGDGAISRTCAEALIELPDGEDSQAVLTVPVAVRYRPTF